MTTVLGFEPGVKRDPLVVTYSDIQMFKVCRRQWMLRHFLGLKPKTEPTFGPLPLGRRVHDALEGYYKYGQDPVVMYQTLAQTERENLIRLNMPLEREDWEKEAELGAIMIAGYMQWLEETGADSEYETIGAEQKLTYQLTVAGVRIELRGKLDQRCRNVISGARLVVDHKTTASFSNLETVAPYDEQLLLYMLLERLTSPNRPGDWTQGAMFNMLRKVKRGPRSKPPYYKRLEVHHNDTTLRSFWYRLMGTLQEYVAVVQQLDSGVSHLGVAYPTSGSQCRYCPFKLPCILADDGSDVEGMLANLYTPYDPHLRYEEEPASFLDQAATYS